jgi:hypothetical protein
LFQGAITYGEAGQFLTPEPVCELMARLMISDNQPSNEGDRKAISDPCCGSGRMLIAAAKIHPGSDLVGQDVDVRCVRMTALNLAFRNLYGFVIWGNTLRLEQKLIYRTGFDLRGFVRELSLDDCPPAVQEAASEPLPAPPMTPTASEAPASVEHAEGRPDTERRRPGTQLRFF